MDQIPLRLATFGGSIDYFTGFEAFPITVNDGAETGWIRSAVLPRLDCGNGRDSCLITRLQTIKDIIITQLQFSHSIDAIVTFLAHYQTMKPYNPGKIVPADPTS